MKLIKFALVVMAVSAAGCRRSEKVEAGFATPAVTLSREKVALGSPVDITYSFAVAPDAPPFPEAYRVFVGFIDADEQLMWTDDHNPPTPTTDWKPNQKIAYTRTIFVPVYPYVGEATIRMGLYSTNTQKRVPLTGEHVGQRSYKVARLQLEPQTENVFTLFKDGWHATEVAEHNTFVEWQWTKKTAVVAFKNPKKDCLFYLDLDNPASVFTEPQQVSVSLRDHELDRFNVTPKQQTLRKILINAAQLGSEDMVEIKLDVDKTFVPALMNTGSKDPRELGVRVFHVFVEPVS